MQTRNTCNIVGVKGATMNALTDRPLARGMLFAVVVAILHGCATTSPEPLRKAAAPDQVSQEAQTSQTIQPVQTTPTAPVITPQLHADFAAAVALLKAEQYEKSIEVFQQLAAALPDNAMPLINIAHAFNQQGKPDAAEPHLKQALVIDPDNPIASNELALLYRKKGRFADARPLYENALKKYPNFTIGHKNLGVLCDLYLKDFDCALTHYRLYSVNAPDDKNVKIWINDLQKRTGK
jgi:tetratricopeptide (TPR) repeat protein